MIYKLFKIKNKVYPQFMHEVDEDNPMFVGELSFPLKTGDQIKLESEMERFTSSPIVHITEVDHGYFVETAYSHYELRRVPSTAAS